MQSPVINQPSTVAAPKSDEFRLKERARQFIDDYPDVHGMAYAAARQLLLKYTGKRLDPDTVYWHRFRNAVSSARTFTGWRHYGTPAESMTLIELVMHRFNARDQDAVDELQLYSGFYTDGPQHDAFDERNEVAILPQDVQNDFWALDFSAAFTRKMEAFWAAHSETFCTLAKARFLAAAGSELHSGSLSAKDFKTVTEAVLGTLQPVMTLAALQAPVSSSSGSTLRTFDIGGYVSCEIIRVLDAKGRQLFYVPGESPAFSAFDSEREVYEWVQNHLRRDVSKTAFKSFFLRSTTARQHDAAAFDQHLEQILAHPWQDGQEHVNQTDRIIEGDAFSYLRDIARREMASDAHALLTSNASLRKQMWIGYLNAFVSAFGGLAPLGWPVALTLIGAGIANVGLNIDQAINAATARQRKAGVIGAVFNSIFIVFNLPMLAGIGKAAGAGTLGEELGGEANPSLEGFEGNEVLPDATPASGHMQGIHVLANGETWISLNDLPYRVLYREEWQCWVIVDPENPFAFSGAKPVRLNAQGQWERVVKPNLQGGTPMEEIAGPSSGLAASGKPYATVRSTFWDTYTQFNLQDEERLSEVGLERQKDVINVPEVESDGEVDEDLGVYTDPDGNEHRVFLTADGDYSGNCITSYTMQDSVFNRFLRTGQHGVSNQLGMIDELIDDLGQVGFNNDVTLYRGGCGARGTSGLMFRGSQIMVGDILVNTDITSFSENPYMVRVFASSQAGEASSNFNGVITFDDTSVMFELPQKAYLHATPIAPFSGSSSEAESLFLPGHYFQIDSIEEVVGDSYRLIKVQLREVDKAQPGRGLYDMRTGEPFNREQYATMLGAEARPLVDLFFPVGNHSPVS
ncbi:dermonecrotic toxin domain-containing protein [Pseudomonas sp. NA-150]|uniref:dermonecrotic toxin domain-containing protein n=1 Tax=Pseudomonas sp. NA-150 TaxID=3367525 RepID=UPI0037C5C3C8